MSYATERKMDRLQNEDPENYPWDEKHVARILLKD